MFGANRAPIMSQDEHYLQTDQNELSLEPHHLGVPPSASKTDQNELSHAPILTLSQTGQNEIPHDPSHLGDPSGVYIMISEPIVRSAQTVHLSRVKFVSISK
jgi:hypothetical protein